MNTIKKLSSNGFMLDSFIGDSGLKMNNHWFTVDTMKILKSKKFPYPFENLKVGDVLDQIKLKVADNKYFVYDFVVEPKSSLMIVEGRNLELGEGKGSLNPSPVQVKKDGQMYGMSVKIAFENQSHSGLNLCSNDKVWVGKRVDECLDIADIIYNRLMERSK